ncbi:MAG: hemerythrin family protein [Synechococcus sp.]|nr:hemerythrin family protein [Synechococcus sp.]
METFHWDKYFETGLREVDFQHHFLVNLVNELGEKIASDLVNANDIEIIFKELAEYAHFHFQEEERLMAEVQLCEEYIAIHKKVHQNFLVEVTSMHQSKSFDTPEDMQLLLDFLTHWLIYHILGEDKRMSRQIKAVERGLTPAEAYAIEIQKTVLVDDSKEALIIALENLFHQISERNLELIKLNQSLELQVAERTKELSFANHHLDRLANIDLSTGQKLYGVKL